MPTGPPLASRSSAISRPVLAAARSTSPQHIVELAISIFTLAIPNLAVRDWHRPKNSKHQDSLLPQAAAVPAGAMVRLASLRT